MADGLDFQMLQSPELMSLERKRHLADVLMQGLGDSSPVASPWAAISRSVTPLMGVLLNQSLDKDYKGYSDAATPALAELAKSQDPIAFASASQNPLIRALLPQIAQMQMTNSLQNKSLNERDKAQMQNKLDYEPKIDAARLQATNPLEIQKDVETEKQLLPYKKALLELQQKLGWANLGEQKREFDINSPFGTNNSLFSDQNVSPAKSPTVTTKADFDKLPSGTTYTGADGQTYRKP